MKISVRIVFLFAVLALAGSLLSGCAGAPPGIPPLTLEHAQQMQEQFPKDPDKVVNEYTAIKNEFDRKDPEIAAQAILESAEFTSDPNRYGTPAQVNAIDADTPTAREAIDQKRAQGDQLAREALKQLFRSYPNTKVAQQVKNSGLQKRVDDQIDQRNSHLLSYKIIDSLVTMTGRKPGFSYWFALLLIAVFLKVVTFPLMLKTYKSQREMQKMQPIIKQIQEKYKEDPTEGYRQTQAAYKEHGVNPFAACLPSLVQMPIFIWMYSLIRIYEVHFSHGYFLWVGSGLAQRFPDIIAPNLGQLDIPILLLYAASMYMTMKLMPMSDPQMAQQQKTTTTMMTVMMIYYFMITRWSSAFLLYYLFQNLLSGVQQYYYVYKPRMSAMESMVLTPAVVGPRSTGSSGMAAKVVAPTREITPRRPTRSATNSSMPRPRKKGKNGKR